jgi:PAS domain S-box-containing protein
MLRTAKLSDFLLIVIAMLLLVRFDLGAAEVNDVERAPFKVVMFRSSNIFSPHLIAQDEEMRKALESKTSRTVQFFVEVVGTLNYSPTESGSEFLSLFHRKYHDQSIDLFMAVGIDALRFIQRYRERLLPAVPVLFYNVAEDAVGRQPLPRDVTGVSLKFDVADTLNLATRLQPEARRIVVVAGVAPYDKNWLRRAREAIAASKQKIEVVYLTDLALPAMLENLEKLPRDTIVLYLSVVRDVTGRIFQSWDVAKRVSDASGAPVYGVLETYLGAGVIGGVVPSFKLHGKAAGEMAARLTAEEKAGSIPLQISPSVAMVDWRQLQRWGLDERRLPPGTKIEFRQPSLWEDYYEIIVTAILAGLAQTLLIAALLIHRAKRRRFERTLQRQLQFERLVSELSATLIGAPLSKMDAKVTGGLEQVCAFMSLDRCHVFEYFPRLQSLTLSHHCQPADPQNPSLQFDAAPLPWLFARLQEGRTIALENVLQDLPAEAGEERSYAARSGVKSLLAIPVRTSAELVHGVCFQTIQRHQKWPDALVKRMHFVSDLLVSALARARSEQDLRMSEERYRAVVDEQTELVCRFNRDTTLTFVNAAYASYFATAPENLIGRSFLSLIPEVDRPQAAAQIRSLGESKRIGFQEHRVLGQNGQVRWQHWVDRPILDDAGEVVEFQSVGRDVTEVKLAQEELQESRLRYSLATAAGRVTVWDFDIARDTVRIDPQPPRSAPELSHDEWLALVHPEDRELVLESQKRALANSAAAERGESSLTFPEISFRIVDHKQRLRWMLARGSVLRTAEGRAYRLVGTATDITERKKAEEALAESENRLKMIMDHSPAMMFLKDLQGRYLYINPAFRHFCGKASEEILGRSDLEIFPGAEAEIFRAHDQVVRESGTASVFEEIALHADGPHTALVSKFPLLDGQSKVYATGGMVLDITERKRAEDALRQSEERLRMAMAAGKMGAWEWTPDSKTVAWTKEQSNGSGFDNAAEFTRSHWANALHPDDLPKVRAAFRTAIKEKTDYRAEFRISRSDGTFRWFMSMGSPFYDESGNCLRVVGIAADITESKRDEESLRGALDEVRRLKERLEAENVYLRTELSDVHRQGEIVGSSPAITTTLRHIERVAVTNMTVLILGETGTGKELVARALHQNSARRDRPLVKVNCATLPVNLIESELFGHEKGAFTGALARQVGRFELANGGTIFLDEIGDLPLPLQTKLLRVLQEGEFERLGGGKTIKVDARVIAATNRNLEEALHNESFRHDLYYRLNGYPIHLAPLRERKEDIAALAATFLAEANTRLGRRFYRIPEGVLEALRRYDWPGNIRELQNVIERAVLLSKGNTLELPEGWDTTPISGWIAAKRAAMKAEAPAPTPAEVTLEELERGHILEVLRQSNWRIEGVKGAAAKLGLKPSTLRSRMLKLKLHRDKERFNDALSALGKDSAPH